jgi:uncharacterized repeat protein (TIGR03803 family)
MTKSTLSLIVRSIAAILPLTFYSAAVVAQTNTLITLSDFGQTPTDGFPPQSPLVFDKAGNLYGVTFYGGSANFGTVFELTKKLDGVWARKTLYTFTGRADGGNPIGALVLDAAGNLYGTTEYGGASKTHEFQGYGEVFELSPRGDGTWTEAVLYSFLGDPDGHYPQNGAIFDSAGNLYGTTAEGGAYGGIETGGTIFELMPQQGGGWKESILYSFNLNPQNLSYVSGLTMDRAGNLYGTALNYGEDATGYGGEVFSLSKPGPGGEWSHTTLHTFPGVYFGNNPGGDIASAFSGVILDAHGNLYGAAVYGGAYNYGAVFEVPAGQGPNGPDKILYSFSDEAAYHTGMYPGGGLVFDPSGNLYGTTGQGGLYGGGKIFEMLPPPAGEDTWQIKDLHDFGGQKYNGFTGIDGKYPDASLVLDAEGNLYGVTDNGGYQPHTDTQDGVAFELILH